MVVRGSAHAPLVEAVLEFVQANVHASSDVITRHRSWWRAIVRLGWGRMVPVQDVSGSGVDHGSKMAAADAR